MLSKEFATTQTHTQSANFETKSLFLEVALENMGALAESTGDKYVLLMRDQFTKWYEAIPMSNQEASAVDMAFANVWA